MNRLWAPWRMKYITSAGNEDGCVFCETPKAENDRERLILRRGEHTFTIMNLYPYTNGHLMVVPYRHVPDITELTPDEHLEIMSEASLGTRVLRNAQKCEGLNLGINMGQGAGAGIADHVHMHIVPRWNGDTNFMTVMDDTRVISEALDETWEKLVAAYAELG